MFSKIDRWVYAQAKIRGASLNPPIARWGIFQIAIGLSTSSFALSVSFIAICLSLWSETMGIAIVALVFASLAFAFAVFIWIYSIHLARTWLIGGSNDETAEKEDIAVLGTKIDQLGDRLTVSIDNLTNELKLDRESRNGQCANYKPKSDKPTDKPKS